MDYFYTQLKKFGKVKTNAPLAKYCSFEVGGLAKFLIVVDDTEKLVGLLNFVSAEGIDYLILGGGANVLLPDELDDKVVIKIKNKEQRTKNNVIDCDAGVDLSDLVTISIAAGLTGLEWAAGIPGTVGGAVRGNAGAHYAFAGGEIKDNLASVKVWRDGEVVELPNKDCAFLYRDSVFKHNTDVILSAKFKLKPGDKRESLSIVQRIVEERKGKHAAEPSAGSFFKNVMLEQWKKPESELPERFIKYKKIAAGWLIDQCGLKGYKVGGAMVSLTHGNFIINADNASQSDVLQVVEEVKKRVYDKFGVELEEEVQIVR